MLSIGPVASPAQGAAYYERDGYYAKDAPEHKSASAWAGKGAEELGLEGPVDADVFRAVLEGSVLDGSGRRLGRRGRDGEFHHRLGRDLTFSASRRSKGIRGMPREAPGKDGEAARGKEMTPDGASATDRAKQRDGAAAPPRDREMAAPERRRTRDMDLGL